MKKNLGKIDRTIRVIVGLAILALGAANGTWLGLIGLVPLLTGALGFCPAYCPLRLNSCGREGC
jgi:hypothetical protein